MYVEHNGDSLMMVTSIGMAWRIAREHAQAKGLNEARAEADAESWFEGRMNGRQHGSAAALRLYLMRRLRDPRTAMKG